MRQSLTRPALLASALVLGLTVPALAQGVPGSAAAAGTSATPNRPAASAPATPGAATTQARPATPANPGGATQPAQAQQQQRPATAPSAGQPPVRPAERHGNTSGGAATTAPTIGGGASGTSGSGPTRTN